MSKIMELADAVIDHAYNDGVLKLGREDDRTAAARAALQAEVERKDEAIKLALAEMEQCNQRTFTEWGLVMIDTQVIDMLKVALHEQG
jgi:hypothetical protein